MVNIIKRIIIGSIKAYQTHFSQNVAQSCRYYPSCSSYAIQSIERKGLVLGIITSIFRVLRCNKYFDGGYDPV